MGWSCGQLAGFRMDRWMALCVASSGSSNVWKDGSDSYFWQQSNREHNDGAITGTIFRNLPDEKCIKSGSFKINGDGTIDRAPKFLKAKCYLLWVDNKCEGLWSPERGMPAPCFETLREHIKGVWIKQYLKGGVNYHVSESLGHVPYPNSAFITDMDDGVKVAEWKAAMFEAW